MAYFADDFNRTSPPGPGSSTAGSPDYLLGSNWVDWNAGGVVGAIIFNNGFYWYENWSFHAGAYPTLVTDTDDQAIEFTITDADNEFRIGFRAAAAMIAAGDTDLDDPDAHTAPGQITMRIQMDQGTPGQVTMIVDGSYQGPTNITGSTSYNDGAPHTFRGEIEGNEVRLYIDGALKFTRNDMGTLPSGATRRRIGLTAAGASEVQRFDSFSCGDFPLTPPPPAAPTITLVGAGHERAGLEWTAGSDNGSAVTDWDIDHATLATATTFSYTGAFQTYVVPAGVTMLQVDAYGAEGGGEYAGTTLTGKGERVKCHVPVIPGETLRVYVGQQGATASSITDDVAASFNGGGQGWNGAGAGGGATDIRRSPYALADRLVVAGGGGGAGCNNGQITTGGGGDADTPTGLTGQDGIGGPTGGTGGTNAAGGTGGSGIDPGDAGVLGEGGQGGSDLRGGGGGGGGRYGGGGGGSGGAGTAGGGGGGGSGLSTGISEVLESGVRSGNGTVDIATFTNWLGPTSTGSTNLYGAITGLTNSTPYAFRVRAVNANGDGDWSLHSIAVTPLDVRGFFDLENGDEMLLEGGTDKQLLEAGAAAGGPATVQRTGSLSGTGTLTATRLLERLRTSSLTGIGTLTATKLRIVLKTGSLTGTGTLTATRLIERVRTASLSGTGTLTATGLIVKLRTASLSGTGTLTATRLIERVRTASLTGIGTFTATRLIIQPRIGSLTGTGTLTGAGIKATNPPTLLTPIDDADVDLTDGQEFTWEHNGAGAQEEFAFRRRIPSGSWQWWNGSAWQSTEIFITSSTESLTFGVGEW